VDGGDEERWMILKKSAARTATMMEAMTERITVTIAKTVQFLPLRKVVLKVTKTMESRAEKTIKIAKTGTYEFRNGLAIYFLRNWNSAR
jgi:hypothetical protein